jgi:hypothetical protein
MEIAYSKLREKYRDLVQYILKTEVGDALTKAQYQIVYRTKNVRKSIDRDMQEYYAELKHTGGVMKISDPYWDDYKFSVFIKEHFDENGTVYLIDLTEAARLYFEGQGLEQPPSEDDPRKQDETENNNDFAEIPEFLRSFINNEAFTKMFDNMCSVGSEDKREASDGEQNVAPIEFPEEIVKLAQELSAEIQIPDFLNLDGSPSAESSTPKKLFEKLTTQEGQQVFRNLIQKTSEKIKGKIDSGEIDEEKIRSSAQDCLKSFLEKNSDLQDMLSKNFPGQAFDILNQTMGRSEAGPSCGQAHHPGRSEARARLQRKLQNKKKVAE